MTKKQIKRRSRKSNKKSRVNPITPLNFDGIDCIDTGNNQNDNNPISKQNNSKLITKTSQNKTEDKTKNNKYNIVKMSQSKTKNNKDNKDNKDNKTKNNNNKNKKIRKPPKRHPHDLLKLYEKETINLSQYRAGERLILDYENSFRNRCSLAFAGEVKIQKSKINHEANLIQNLYAWERYSKAITSIDDIKTKEVLRMFCIDGIGLSKIDRTLGKMGAAEVRLCYGLKDLARHYRGLREE